MTGTSYGHPALRGMRSVTRVSSRTGRRKTQMFVGPQATERARELFDYATEHGEEPTIARWDGSVWVPCERDDDTP